MDISSLGIVSVAAVTVICYGLGLVAKLTPWYSDKLIPALCALSGAVLGIVALYGGVPDFPAHDPLSAAAVGIVSGLAATGINQVYKQLKGA